MCQVSLFVFSGVCVWVVDSSRDNVWPVTSSGSWTTGGLCFNPLIWVLLWKTYHSVQYNPISKKNKIAAMPSLCSWRSGETVIDLQQLLSFFSYLRYLLNRLLHWFLGRQMVVCMLQDNWRNEELFSSVDQIQYSDVFRVRFYCA